MSRRGPAASGRSSAAALQTASSEMDRLRTELLSSLTDVITDTVDMVCEQYEENLTQAVHQLNGGRANGAGGAVSGGGGRGNGSLPTRPSSKASRSGTDTDPNDYDLFHRCCERLVDYINDNMVTSPDFKQQMDRVILACHSNASESVLATVVTRELWCRIKTPGRSDEDDERVPDDASVDDSRDDDYDEAMVEMRIHSAKKKKAAAKAAAAPPPSRSAKRRLSAPPPSPPPRRAKMKSPVKKRARRDSASRSTKYARSDDEEEEEEEEVERKRKRRAPRIHYSEDEEETEQNDDDDDVVVVKNDAAKQPHYGQADELLTFKDAIGDMCYADRRTPAQTRFFKERLRQAIKFVDAQLCKPPKGKSCGWECAKIRRQMCNRDLPCRNKICRLWHDVEAHTDRCQNQQCEFRIRVMLRETMYKIDHKKMELQGFKSELHTKKKELLDLKSESVPDRENFVERSLLSNEIDQLESEIENAESEIAVFKATKKTYWGTLNEIGITEEDDDNDQFPSFKGHYVDKKMAAKKKAPTKTVRRSDESPTPVPSSRSDRSRRRQSVESATSATSPVRTRERITRRSTQQSLRVLTNGVIELDGDDDDEGNEEEEAKTDRSVEDDDVQRAERAEDEVDETNGNAQDDQDSREHDGDEESVKAPNKVQDDRDEDEAMVGNDDAEESASSVPETSASNGSADATQSADYVIEDAQPEASSATTNPESTKSSAIDAFNQVLDAHSVQQVEDRAADVETEKGDKEDEADNTTAAEEDNTPLLPF